MRVIGGVTFLVLLLLIIVSCGEQPVEETDLTDSPQQKDVVSSEKTQPYDGLEEAVKELDEVE